MNSSPRPKVFVTRNIMEAGLAVLRESCEVEVWPHDLPPSPEQLLQHARGVDAILTMLSDGLSGEVMDQIGPQLKVISNYAVGFNNIDVPAATQRSIRVGNTPGVLTEATADIAAGLILSAARHLQPASKSVYRGDWKTWEPLGFIGTDLVGKTLGIVGLGRIGVALAKRFHFGWDMPVLYSGRTPKPEAEEQLSARKVEFETLIKEADIISVHCDMNPTTSKMFNADVFQQMKPTSIFINTARGGVHDQAALYQALKHKQIAAAGLDVTDPEPIPLDDPLLTLPNCVIVPHIGSATEETRTNMALIAAENILKGLRGEPLPHPVNPDVEN